MKVSGSLIISTIVSLVGAVLNLASILLNIPELFLVGRLIGSMGSGTSFGALILFLQVRVVVVDKRRLIREVRVVI